MKLLIPPPIVGLVCGAAMWGLSRQFPSTAIDFSLRPWVALGLVMIGVLIEAISVYKFLKAKTTVTPLNPDKASSLVVSGLYRYSRNPMYLGMFALLTGWALWLANPLSVLVLPIFVGYLTWFQIKPEEEALAAKFGAEYSAYCQRVRRWL
ncbi:MAG: isoprenylcysteine carboxylmethyltransferase family protein [Pseudomonadota bacterium]